MARPSIEKRDPATAARIIELAEKSGMKPIEIAEHPDVRGKASQRAVYDVVERWKARRAEAKPPVALAVVEAEPVEPAEPLTLPIAEPLTGERAERAAIVRQLAVEGKLDHEAVARLALTFKCTEGEAAQALQDADRLAASTALPAHLAREASVGSFRRLMKAAEDANDWKSAAMIQGQIDRVRGVGGKGAAPGEVPSGYVPAADVEGLLRRLFAALAPWPEAQAAFRAAYRAT